MPATDVFGAIANPVRREILDLLREGPRPAGEIAGRFDQNRPAVSEHLQVLRSVGLVESEVVGRQRIYQLTPQSLSQIERWLQPFEGYWRRRLRALEQTLAEEEP